MRKRRTNEIQSQQKNENNKRVEINEIREQKSNFKKVKKRRALSLKR